MKIRWGNRRREIEEVEKKIEEAKKRKEEKRKRVIRERRCFVCGIFGHMACYCRNRGEKKRSTQMPLNKFEILKDRVMQGGEGSEKEIGKEKREILREERKKNIIQVQTSGKDKKEKKKGVDEKKKEIKKVEEMKEIEKEERKMEKKEKKELTEIKVEMQGFSRGEILKGRYPLVW